MTILIPLLLGLVAGTVQAGDTAPHVDAGLYTDFPTSVGLRGTVELPGRLRLSLGGGVLPDPYLASIHGVATGAGWYSDELATLIDTALTRAWVLRSQVGWRPWEDRGFVASGGVQQVLAVGGEAVAEEVKAGFRAAAADGSDYFPRSRLTLLTVDVGHEWILQERLVLRATLGGAFTLGASTKAEELAKAEAPFDRLRAAGRGLLEDYLDDTYTRYVHTPSLGVEIGWRFR